MYDEDDYLQLSGIQHFAFCRRQWALAYIEMQWQENVRTVEGKILHENAHNPGLKEKRGDLLIVRAMPVHSCEMCATLSVRRLLTLIAKHLITQVHIITHKNYLRNILQILSANFRRFILNFDILF